MKTNLKYFLPFIILISPILYIPIVPDPAQSPVFWLFLIGIIVSVLFQWDRKEEILSNRLINYLFFGFIGLGTFSFLFIASHSESSLEYFRIVFFAISYIYFMSQYEHFKQFLVVFILLGGFYFLYGLLDYKKYYNTEIAYNGLYNIRAAIGHKNLMSMYLCLSFPFLFYGFYKAKGMSLKLLLGLYFIFAVALILLCKSRVGMIGVFINTLAILIYIYKSKKNLFYQLTICLILLSILTHFGLRNNDEYKKLMRRASSIVYFQKELDENNRSVNERLILWKKTVDLIKDYPILGCGLGQWKLLIYSKNINATRAKFGNIIFQQPHNDFLWVISEYGIFGGLAFISLIFYPLFLLIISKNNDALSYCLILFLIVYAAVSLFDFPKERPQFLLILAFVLAIVSRKFYTKEIRIAKYFFLVVILFSILFFTKRLMAEGYMAQLIQARGQSKHEKVIQYAHKIKKLHIEYDHTSTPLDFFIGEALFYKNNIPNSISYLKKSIQHSPYHLYTWTNLGTAYYKNAEEVKAVYAWEKAKEIAIDFAEPRLNLATYYISKNDIDEAENQLHFQIEREDIEKYKERWNWIVDSLIAKRSANNPNAIYQSELEEIQSNPKRKFWLFQTFCKDSLSFQKQVESDVFYSLFYNKKWGDSSLVKKVLSIPKMD